jgi:microcystin-dependent protein
MAEPFLGEIRMFGFNFPPRGWAHCNGQVLPIYQNQALFSLIGLAFGGNGQTTFALPDLRGRVPLHFGQGPGLSERELGGFYTGGGSEQATLSYRNLGAVPQPLNPDENSSIAQSSGTEEQSRQNPQMVLAPSSNFEPISIMQPYLAINFCICLEGVLPERW